MKTRVNARKRGFTLVEAVITLAVSAALISIVSGLVASLANSGRKSEHLGSVYADLTLIREEIRSWFDFYSEVLSGENLYEILPVNAEKNGEGADIFTASENGSRLAVYRAEGQTDLSEPVATVYFDEERRVLFCSDRYVRPHLKNVQSVVFKKEGNAILVFVRYDGDFQMTVFLGGLYAKICV